MSSGLLISMPRGKNTSRSRGRRSIRVTHGVHFTDTEEVTTVPNRGIVHPPCVVEDQNDQPAVETVVQPPAQTVVQPTIETAVRRAPRYKWTKEDMESTILCVRENNMSIRGASIKYGIPTSSLRSWLTGVTSTMTRGPRTILSEEEVEVVQWCKDMAEIGHDIEISQLQTTVAQMTTTRPNPFTNGMPGKSWWAGYRKRHPDLTMRIAEGVDSDRAIMLRPSIVSSFYDNLENIYKLHQYGSN